MKNRMRLTRTLFASAVAASLVATTAIQATSAVNVESEGNLDTQRLDEAFQALKDADVPALIAEVRHGDEVWTSADGYRVIDGTKPVETTDRFRAASLTKSMVATVVLQLQGEGLLDIDDTVEEHLPGLLPYTEDITIQNLLQHTSGLANDYLGGYIHEGVYRHRDWASLEQTKWTRADPLEHVQLGTQMPLAFEPGTQFQYSNTGYSIVGLIIEEVTGKPLHRELRHRVYKPAGMTDSYLARLSHYTVKGKSMGSYFETDSAAQPYVDTTTLSASQLWAAGGTVSTVGDINRFYRAQMDGTLLTAEQYEEATDLFLTEGARHGYGLGLSVEDLGCGLAIGHNGDAIGHQTRSIHSFDGERQVTLAWNVDDRLFPHTTRRVAALNLMVAGLCPDDVDTIDTGELARQLAEQNPDPGLAETLG